MGRKEERDRVKKNQGRGNRRRVTVLESSQ